MTFFYYGPEDVHTMGIELLLNCWTVEWLMKVANNSDYSNDKSC